MEIATDKELPEWILESGQRKDKISENQIDVMTFHYKEMENRDTPMEWHPRG